MQGKKCLLLNNLLARTCTVSGYFLLSIEHLLFYQWRCKLNWTSQFLNRTMSPKQLSSMRVECLRRYLMLWIWVWPGRAENKGWLWTMSKCCNMREFLCPNLLWATFVCTILIWVELEPHYDPLILTWIRVISSFVYDAINGHLSSCSMAFHVAVGVTSTPS